MESMFVPIVAATSVAMIAWWVFATFSGGGDKQKLHARLTGEGSNGAGESGEGASVVLASSLNALPDFLREKPWAQKVQNVLSQAYPDAKIKNFLTLVASMAVGGFVIALLIWHNLLVAVGAMAVLGYIPFYFVTSQRGRRQQKINKQLPEALEFLSRVMKAGHSLSTGLQMMADELPKPLSDEFRRAYDQHSLGQSLEDSLKGAAARVNSTDFAFFVTSVLIQRQTGGDLSEVLGNISNMIRARIHLQQHVKAKTAEGRFTGYIMVAFPAIMFAICYFLNPGYTGVLIHTKTGQEMLGVAFGLQIAGLYMTKKITTVRI